MDLTILAASTLLGVAVAGFAAEGSSAIGSAAEYELQDIQKIVRTGAGVSYVGENHEWGHYETEEGDKLYSLELDTPWPEPGQEIYPIEQEDPCVDYLLSNGYPYESIRGNDFVDRFITQAAIWLHTDRLNGKESMRAFLEDNADPYELVPNTEDFLEEAEGAKGDDSADQVVSIAEGEFTASERYGFVSPELTVRLRAGESAQLSLGGAEERGAYVIDSEGAKRSVVAAGERLRVVVPPECANSVDSISLTATAEVSRPRTVFYRTSLEDNQERLVGLVDTDGTLKTTVRIPCRVGMGKYLPLFMGVAGGFAVGMLGLAAGRILRR